MKKVLIYSLLAVTMVSLYGCKGTEPAPIGPKKGKLYLALKRRGAYLADSLMDKVQISYTNQQGVTIVNPNQDPNGPSGLSFDDQYMFQRVGGGGSLSKPPVPGLLSSSVIPRVIDQSAIKEFYLTYADGYVDTLLLEMDKVSEEQAANERCKCIYPFRSVTYRGRKAIEDTTIHPEINADPPVFLIER